MEIAPGMVKTEPPEDAVPSKVPEIELGEVKLENNGTSIDKDPLECSCFPDEVKEELILTVDHGMLLPMDMAKPIPPPVTIKEEPQELEEDDPFAESHVELSRVTIKSEPAESEDEEAEPDPSSSSEPRNSQMFMCYHCGAAHQDKDSMAQHIGLHFSDLAGGLHRCPQCDFYGREHPLKEHALRTHGNEEPFLCKMCSFKADFLYKVRRHVSETHQEYRFHCSQCTSSYRFKYELLRHVHKNHRTEYTRYSCSLCNFKSLDKKDFDRHKQLFHMAYKCLQCDYKCKFDFRLVKHIRAKHYAILCKFCDFTARFPSQMKKHVSRNHQQKRIKCSLCPKLLNSTLELRKHRNSEHYAGASCPHCYRKFRNSRYLASHIRKVHDEKSITCSLCCHAFRYRKDLKAHEAAYHFHGNPYTCSHCPVMCATAKKLRYHENKEHGILNKGCTLCDFKCKSRREMIKHMSFLHGISKIYQCAHCSYKTSFRGHMVDHTVVHLPDCAHNCGICGRVYKRRQTLTNHMRVHETKRIVPFFTMDQL